MKKILFNILFLIISPIILNGCGFIYTYLLYMIDSHCSDWNCNAQDPRWSQEVIQCSFRNSNILILELGYKNQIDARSSEIGKIISTKCLQNSGKYNIKKDEEYNHLFSSETSVEKICPKYNPYRLINIVSCTNKNADVLMSIKEFGFETYSDLMESEFYEEVSYSCICNGGDYDIREDKKYKHIFKK